ncbi:LOW QUALITY PROTEIN: A-kinase anchor protein 9 [Triplophysa rosa]|uniref:LOW QUALITY PROTEIN: A-kinase anchor protein 9 n=1 Tax=Triplophysa rosa TaxID=992332 RepID=UPI00254603E9|nr:LOW QUALITY PROTEIN: A-kinase anchor protein 9 [Triplophysa rosa]
MMEDDERQKKLQAGKAKLAEYRQRKALSDGQKKQKKRKKKGESEEQRRDDEDQTLGEQRGDQTTVFSLSKTLRSGETVTHDQTYAIEPESEVSTTAEDCSSEVNGFQERTGDGLASVMGEDEETHVEPDLQSGSPTQIVQDELAAKTLAMEELSRELEEIRAAFGTEGVQQLQDFEEALKQRDEIITQLTTNLQQARVEKEEVMREFLELTEQSQKLQIQFQQLQAGQILRSSSISSTAADLLQARQQISLYQQQLEERDAQVKGRQEKTQEHLLLISQLQERLDQADTVRSQAEESLSQRLQDKDLQTLSHIQDQLLTTTQQLDEVNKHLSAKTQELENCERELSVSRQKERMSSTEILQLMKTVEDLQQRCHQGSQSEGQTIQRIEEDWTRRMDQLRAELDEMYGQQIAQMKQELRVQHASEMDRMREQHSEDTEKIVLQHCSELERFKGQLSHSTGDVNVLNVRLIDLQQKLQESQVLREKAERELMQSNAENIDLVNQMERLHQELQSVRAEVEIRSKSPERSRMDSQLLRDAISDLQAQLDAAQKTASDMEAKHESEITNYRIKLDMLEREKDAVLDRMAESLEAELERLRTQLLFSHEEELSQLRNDLQRESQLNGENLRDEMAVRHREAVELLRMDFEDKLRSVEDERAVLAAERGALLQDISVLKTDLNRALESSRAEELVIQLRELQTEAENLKRRGKTKEGDWERRRQEVESENKILKETNTAMRDELMLLKDDHEILLQKTQHLSLEYEQTHTRLKDLRDEIEKQRNTFSFAEKNFEVNYQELKDEYTCLVNAKVQLEERLIKETMDYETKLRELQTRNKTEDEEALVEKDATELMEKLETSEREKKILTQSLSESIAQVTLMEADVKRLKEELKRDRGETAEDCSVAGGPCSLEAHHAHIRCLEEETETLKSSLTSAERERERLRDLTQENSALVKRLGVYRDPSSQAAAAAQQSEGGERETPASTTAEALAERTHAAAHEDVLTEPDGRRPQQVKTNDPEDDGDFVRTQCLIQTQDMDDSDHEECRLQLEAQRISLSQIHAAQLELLRESLHAQTAAQLRSRDQELQDAHERELLCLQEEMRSEQQEVRGQSAEFQERHRQETERLKIYYHQQMKETQERCTADILLLERRLQELTGTQQLFSMPSVSPPLTTDQPCEHDQDQESLSTEVEAGLTRELQAVQEAQSESERQMKHHQELLEEEIAKVIVQMSVEFARHTEHTRLSKKARETSASTQTLNAEDHTLTDHHSDAVTMATSQHHTQGPEEDDDDEEQRPAVPLEDFGSELVQQEEEHTRVLEALRASHTHQMEILQEQNTHLTTQIHTLNQQLIQREQELMRETQRDDLMHPSMQSSSTQTEQKRDEDEETKSRGREEPVTSQQAAQELFSDVIIAERDLLRKANARLRQVLVDVLKTTAAAEETIGRHVEGILQGSSKESFKAFSAPAGDASSEDVGVFSGELDTEEGLERSQGVELQLQEAEFELEREEHLMSISTRLQSAVKKLLITITETSTELEHAHITQTELMREKFRHNEEMEELVIRQEELQERLREEARGREQLALELHKAEGLIDGYTGERLALEQQGRERAELQRHLEQELRITSNRLHELEHERQQIQQERELLSRQQDAMRDGAGSRELRLVEAALDAAPEADLLGETEKLMAEKVEVQRQAQKESGELLLQVKQLEAELEEQVNRVQELEETRGTEAADLTQQIQALEKQLEKNRKFMDEQAADREHERDVFQQEIQNLEQQLKNPQKTQTGSERREREVHDHKSPAGETLDIKTAPVMERSANKQNDLSEHLSDHCCQVNSSIAAVKVTQAPPPDVVEEVQHVSMAGSGGDVTLEEQLQTEKEALDRKEKEILNLEEQLEQFREELENKSEEVNQLHMQLEIQRKEISSHQHDLQAQSRLTQVLEEKDGQIAVLNAQISKLQHTGTDTQNEAVQEKNEVVRELESQVEHLRNEQERLKRNNEEEMDQLNAVIEKLQQELLNIEHKQPHEEETSVGKDDYHEMKQKMDEVTKELDTLKSHQRSLLSKYEDLQEEALAGRHAETVAELQEALREKTAAFVVGQAQVQALEESASSKVMDLRQRVEELEMCVEEKDSELRVCRMKVERAQSDAEALFCKVAQLEEKLREKVAAVLVAQAQLGAIQTQSKELHDEAQDVTSKLCGTRTQLEPEGPWMKVQSKDTQSQSEGPSVQVESDGPKTQSEGPGVQVESEGPKTQSEGPKTQSEGPKTQSEGPKGQSEGPKTQSEGPKAQSEDPKTQSEGPSVQLESEGPKTQSEGPKAQSEGPGVQLESEGPKTQSEGPGVQLESEGHKTQSEGPSVQLESEGPKTQSEGPGVQLESEGHKTQSEGPSVQLESEGPKTQSEGPGVQLESEGHKTQSEGPSVQLESEGPKTQSEGPGVQLESEGHKTQSEGPSVQLESEGPKTQSEGPGVQLESEGHKTQSEGPSVQLESEGPKTQSEGPGVQLESEGHKTQSEGPSVQLESEGPKTQSEGPGVQLESEGHKTQSEGPSVQLESEGPKTQSEGPGVQLESEGHKTQSEGPSVQLESEGPKTQSEGPGVQLESEGHKTQSEGPSVQLESEGPKTQSEGPGVQLESEGHKTQSEGPSVQLESEGPKTQSEGPGVQLESEGPKTQSEGPGVQLESEGHKTQSEGPSVQLESEGPKTQSEGPGVQLESEGHKTQSEGPSVQLESEGPKTQSEGPGVQLESEGPKTQSEGPGVQLESEGHKTQSEGPGVQLESEGHKTQSEGPSVQLESEGPKTQSEGPGVQLESEGPKTKSEGPDVQLESEGPKTQSEDPKTQPEGPKTQSEGPIMQVESDGSGVKLDSEDPSFQIESEGAGVQLDSEAVASSPADKVNLLTEKLKELEEGLSGMQKDQELQKQLLCSSEEEVQEYERRLALLMDLLNQMRTKASHHRPDSSDEVSGGNQSVSEILQQLQEVKGEAASTKEELKCYRELSHKLQEDTEMKESTITQLQAALTQMSAGTREEDTAEAAKLLQEVKGQLSITQQELESFRDQSVRLQELLQEREMSIALLKDQLHRQTSREEDGSTSELLQELQEVKDEAASTKEELNNYRECSLKLQEQIEVRDVSIAQLKEEVQELRALTEASDEPPSQPKNKNEDNREHHGKNKTGDSSKDTLSLSYELSSDQSERFTSCSSLNGTRLTPRVDAETQADLSGAVDVEEMITGYTEKIGQMQELHAAEIMDMEARHISESESLKRERQQLEERCGALGDALQKLRSAEGPSVRSERPSVSPFKEGYTSDSSSEWGQRTGYDLPHPHQELRTTPEGARRDVEPDILPDRIKTLLREVHQEGMQVLCLSEAERSGEQQLHHQTWSVERDALIKSIQSLIDFISQIQSDTQVDGDWRAELLSAVQQVFVRERDVLKNVLHSHVERLDSTDPVIHLNQLLREITEQDVRHRDVMGLLCSADRNSLITEIHQLRAQRHPVDTSAGNQRESEERQTELKQTQLELESSLKSQHRLMKDLDTLRAEMSLKTAELDALNDTLASEQKRVRELQWLYEKDKCKADRKQEAEREEVEDLKLMLEEQRARVAELSSALERETQMTREQTDGEQGCEVSVSSELQVQLEAQRCRAAELSSALEREKHLNAQLMQHMQTSVTPAAGTHDTLLQAEATCSQVEAGVLSVESLLQTLQAQLAEKQTQVVQLMEQMEKQKVDELQRRRQFEEEKSSLTRSAAQDQSELRAARDSVARLERQTDDLRVQLDAERDDLQRLERERDRLQERVRQLEEKLRLVDNKESVRSDGQSADRTLDWVLQQKTSETQDSSTPTGANQSSDPKHVNNILNRLQLIAAKITSLTSDTPDRLSVEAADRDILTWLHNNVQDVMSLLQHIPSAPSALLEVSLRSSAERHESERDAWIHERSRLEKSLRRAEAELSRVRADIRSDALRDLTGCDVDSSALKKIYSKYLRAESFRKALIYQKKYLLLLLGGFQECEEATLSLIARMGGHPTHACLESLGHPRRGFTRFRSAVRVSIALSRMKFLVKRWQRAAGGSLTSQIISRNGQMTGADVRNESSYLHPGGVDAFRERRAGSRGRTGRESPRSAASVTHRYHSMAGDPGGLSCSHLQNYDPDRALTDYISRLEALQRRLGSVQSGSTAQMHFGVRR